MADAYLIDMKLYYAPGACSLSPHIALRETERPFELERVDLRSHKTWGGADYFEINPKGEVPALEIARDSIMTENVAVLQYIADLAPQRGLAPPNGTFARYHLQEWLAFISTELHKELSPLFEPDTPPPTAERARTRIEERLQFVAHSMEGKPFLMGDKFTVADTYLFVMLRWCERLKVQWRPLHEYFQRIMERPAVHAALVAEGLIETKRHRRTA